MVWVYQNLIIYSPIEGHLGCFQFGTDTNQAAEKHLCPNIYMEMCFCVSFTQVTLPGHSNFIT